MSNISFFSCSRWVNRLVFTALARRLAACVPASHEVSCDLPHERGGHTYLASFKGYQQALMAPTMAIFRDAHDRRL